jgi:tRNA (guanine37-N1)-methyltransferase
MFDSVIGESMLKRARQKGLLRINVHDLRDWTSDNHRTADDKPFGGGPGMVMKVEPVYRALKELQAVRGFTSSRVRVMSHRRTAKDNSRTHEHANSRTKVILLTPQGKRLDQGMVRRLSKEKSLTLICGHYEGFDERIRHLVDEEISIGDYVLTCGEIPALVIIDAVARLLPGVLGGDGSLATESFEHGLLEYPHYTRPAEFEGMKVPEILLSGDHRKIEAWRKARALERTAQRRPDLLKKR